jgi:hypothetical protein
MEGNDSDLMYPSDIEQHFQALEAYIDFVTEQNELLNSLEDSLSTILIRFPRISSIIFVNDFMDNLKDCPFKHALQRDSISRKWVRPSQALPLFSAIKKSNCKISHIGVEGHYVLKKYPGNELAAWSEEADTPGSIKYSIPDLDSARYWKEKMPYFTSAVFDLNSEALINMQSIFQHLTSLDLCVSTVVPMHNLLSRPPPRTYVSFYCHTYRTITSFFDPAH